MNSLVPTTFTARRLRPYVAVGINGAPATRQYTRRANRWRLGQALAFQDAIKLNCNTATDALRVELWRHRRLRPDVLVRRPAANTVGGWGTQPLTWPRRYPR
jgi:hypothetical protein